jgi:hypothetical protein
MSTNESQISGNQLQDEGWTRRFTALGRRLNEVVELYRELGFEVRLEPVDLDQEETMSVESCKDCFVTIQARTIYTRPKIKDSKALNKLIGNSVGADLSRTQPIHRP